MIGSINGHLVGVAMKELAFRAMRKIRELKDEFTVYEKKGLDGGADLVTTADLEAQEIYVRALTEWFPGVGIVGEEDGLKVPCTIEGHNIFFTLDPVDGTKALARLQASGVATMISLVVNGGVVAAYIGDVNAGQLYGFRPGSEHVHRLTDYSYAETMVIDPDCTLKQKTIVLRTDPRLASPLAQKLTWPSRKHAHAPHAGLCKKVTVASGSVGTMFARLWKGEVGALLLKSMPLTPWDWAPIAGISLQMGFQFYSVGDGGIYPYEPSITNEIQDNPYEILVIPGVCQNELMEWCNTYFIG